MQRLRGGFQIFPLTPRKFKTDPVWPFDQVIGLGQRKIESMDFELGEMYCFVDKPLGNVRCYKLKRVAMGCPYFDVNGNFFGERVRMEDVKWIHPYVFAEPKRRDLASQTELSIPPNAVVRIEFD